MILRCCFLLLSFILRLVEIAKNDAVQLRAVDIAVDSIFDSKEGYLIKGIPEI